MEDYFNIYVDRLKSGSEELISFSAAPTFMELTEDELLFNENIEVEGKAYLTEEHLILHLDISTKAIMPCKMCNEPKPYIVDIKGFYHTQDLDKIKSGQFSIADIVRDAILLDLPNYYECKLDSCEGRDIANKFLKSQEQAHEIDDPEVYHPFADLE
ncbi:MAG: hypothetical protein P0S95_06665 [Rhabdochlamydiaceae bacterium]|nr:hypothetical protein [Candidatus Amphrikana amoebophyrae]